MMNENEKQDGEPVDGLSEDLAAQLARFDGYWRTAPIAGDDAAAIGRLAEMGRLERRAASRRGGLALWRRPDLAPPEAMPWVGKRRR